MPVLTSTALWSRILVQEAPVAGGGTMVEYVTVLWGMSREVGDPSSALDPYWKPKELGGQVRANFGGFTQAQMVKLNEGRFAQWNPSYDPCIIRIFSFEGADAVKVHFLAGLACRCREMDFCQVFRAIAETSTFHTLMWPKHRKGWWHAHEQEFELLKAAKFARFFNYWPMLHRFERMVQAAVLEDPQSFAAAIWTTELRKSMAA